MINLSWLKAHNNIHVQSLLNFVNIKTLKVKIKAESAKAEAVFTRLKKVEADRVQDTGKADNGRHLPRAETCLWELNDWYTTENQLCQCLHTDHFTSRDIWSINQSINQNYLKWPKWWKPLQGPLSEEVTVKWCQNARTITLQENFKKYAKPFWDNAWLCVYVKRRPAA